MGHLETQVILVLLKIVYALERYAIPSKKVRYRLCYDDPFAVPCLSMATNFG
jgi:hypothetical protein